MEDSRFNGYNYTYRLCHIISNNFDEKDICKFCANPKCITPNRMIKVIYKKNIVESEFKKFIRVENCHKQKYLDFQNCEVCNKWFCYQGELIGIVAERFHIQLYKHSLLK